MWKAKYKRLETGELQKGNLRRETGIDKNEVQEKNWDSFIIKERRI